jgi:hypothetical protein
VLATRLAPVILKDCGTAQAEDKVTAAWTCYHESLAKKAVSDQELPPSRRMSFMDAARNLVQFVCGAVGLLSLIGALCERENIKTLLFSSFSESWGAGTGEPGIAFGWCASRRASSVHGQTGTSVCRHLVRTLSQLV